jgi:NADPH:quinone reductase-like Zn-dependent oxidoreductase
MVVAVKAISLNAGEVRQARTFRPEGYRPGWDLAGFVERAAADGTGPKAGTRVVGILPEGAWTERVAIPVHAVAELPEKVSFAQAACLPVAALTALGCLDLRGNLVGRRVLITGATGGVGHFATQLARFAGAHVVAAVRKVEQAEYVMRHGAHEIVVIGDDPTQAASAGPYDLVLDSLGGVSASASIVMLAPKGICVLFGGTAGVTATFDVRKFYFEGGASVYGFMIFDELVRRDPARAGFHRLLPLVASGQLRVDITIERPWAEIDRIAGDLMDRRYTGKAVLHL